MNPVNWWFYCFALEHNFPDIAHAIHGGPGVAWDGWGARQALALHAFHELGARHASGPSKKRRRERDAPEAASVLSHKARGQARARRD